MTIKRAGHDGESKASKMVWRWNWNKDHVQMDFEHTINATDSGGNDIGFGKEIEESIETPANVKKKIWRLDYRKWRYWIEIPTLNA